MLGGPVDLGRVSWAGHESDRPACARAAGELLGARVDGRRPTLRVLASLPEAAVAVLDGTIELPLQRVDGAHLATLDGDFLPTIVSARWDEGEAGPVVVADVHRLAALARRTSTTVYVPLEALDYGGDEEIRQILDQLARLAIISAHDIDRMLHGRGEPAGSEEAAEASGTAPAIDLEAIDFEALAQHPRSAAYRAGDDNGFDTPRIQLWLDDVVQQFTNSFPGNGSSDYVLAGTTCAAPNLRLGMFPATCSLSSAMRRSWLAGNRLRSWLSGSKHRWELTQPAICFR